MMMMKCRPGMELARCGWRGTRSDWPALTWAEASKGRQAAALSYASNEIYQTPNGQWCGVRICSLFDPVAGKPSAQLIERSGR